MNDNNFGLPDKPDPNEQTLPQQPIFLGAPQEQQPYIQPQQQSPSGRWVPPQGMGSRPLFTNPAGRKRSWKNDPAYRVLFIAIGVVLLSSLAFVGVLAAILNQSSSQTAQAGGPNTQQTANAGRVNIGSPTPTATPVPTPTLAPTPTLVPTPTPTLVTATLTVQITSNIPNPVRNGQAIRVRVTTNKPNVPVSLSITYSFGGGFSTTTTTKSQNTDNQGNATITWNVQTITTGNTTAQVTAIAKDQQGQTATSEPVTVAVQSNFNG